MEEPISLRELIVIFKKRWMLIVMLAIMATAISSSITFFLMTPKYEASTQILVNQNNSGSQLDASQMRSNIEVINTYRVIIKSPVILEKVIETLGLEESVDSLNHNISVNSQSESQVFSISVINTRPEQAVKIANTIATIFQQDIRSIMNVDNVNILAKAVLKEDPAPVSPNPLLNISVGFVIGLIIGIGFAFLLEYFDNTLHSIEDVEAYLGIPVLGYVQKIPKQKEKKSSALHGMGVERIESHVKG